MKNIPVFSTENGIASITLDQIPYNQNAYIHMQDVSDFPEFVTECIGFCKAAGAEQIYATGLDDLKDYSVYTHILQLEILKANIPGDMGEMIPVTMETFSTWKNAYNRSVRNVPGAAGMDEKRAKKALENQQAYFVRYAGETVGLGVVDSMTVQAIVSLAPHMGEIILKTLSSAIESDRFSLEVAENNIPAMKLYERCKCRPIKCVLIWHSLLSENK